MLLLTLLLLSSAVATSLFALPELVVIVVVVVVVVDDDADVLSVLRATLSHGHSRISMFVPPCKKKYIYLRSFPTFHVQILSKKISCFVSYERVCHGFRLAKQDDYFEPSVIFGGSWGGSGNWLVPKTKP